MEGMIARIRRLAPYILETGAALALFGLAWILLRGSLDLVGKIALAAALVAVVAYVALEPARVKAALLGRTARQRSNALVVTLAVIGILVLVNVLAAKHHKRVDLTAERQFSLSKQTLQVLAGLQEPIQVTAFMTPRYYARQQVEDLLKEYTYHSDKLRLEIVDPEQKPAQARQAGVTTDGTVVFRASQRQQTALGSDEQEFTSALVKATRQEAKAVYFLTGHHERDPQDSQENGYQQIADALTRDNYRVDTLNLTITSTVPSDAAVLVLASPTVTPTEKEVQAINAYVDRGGSLLLLDDPQTPATLDPLLARWGLSLRPDIVVDPASSVYGDIATPVVTRFPYHAITKDLTGLMTLFPYSRSIAQPQTPAGVVVSPLAQSSAQSWGETDLQNTQVHLDQGKDASGPLDLAVAATLSIGGTDSTAPQRNARLVLFGGASFVSNGALQVWANAGNADLFLNAASWLAEEESLISIRPTQPVERTILMTPSQARVIMYSSLLFLPGMVVLAGVWVWWRRR